VASPIKAAEGSLDFVIRGEFASLGPRKPFEHRRQMRGIDRISGTASTSIAAIGYLSIR
jgi:hypothetical protein